MLSNFSSDSTLPVFIVVQDTLVIAEVMLLLAEILSLISLVTVHLTAVSQSKAVATRSASRKEQALRRGLGSCSAYKACKTM